jgi:hypothetical protein
MSEKIDESRCRLLVKRALNHRLSDTCFSAKSHAIAHHGRSARNTGFPMSGEKKAASKWTQQQGQPPDQQISVMDLTDYHSASMVSSRRNGCYLDD